MTGKDGNAAEIPTARAARHDLGGGNRLLGLLPGAMAAGARSEVGAGTQHQRQKAVAERVAVGSGLAVLAAVLLLMLLWWWVTIQ